MCRWRIFKLWGCLGKDILVSTFCLYIFEKLAVLDNDPHALLTNFIKKAGAKLTSNAQVVCELQRDWNRKETAKGMVHIFFESGVFLNWNNTIDRSKANRNKCVLCHPAAGVGSRIL